MKKIIFIFILISVIFYGCNQKIIEKGKKISIDIDHCSCIDISNDEFNIQQLSNDKKSNLLGKIKGVSFYEDNIITEASNGIFKYNTKKENTLINFSSKGRANSEYISIWSHWINKDRLYIYDMNGKKVLTHDINGIYINSYSINSNADASPFQLLIPYKNNYIGKRVYDGIDKTDELAYYDSNFNFIKSIPSFKIKSGIKFHYPFAKYNELILYNRYFENIIYQVDENGVKERYYVDFNKHAIPNIHSFVDEYEIIDFLRKKTNSKYASLISNLYESDGFFTFNFISNAKRYIAIHMKETGNTTTICFKGNENIEDIYCNKDKIFVFFTSNNLNYVGIIPITEILRIQI